MLTKSTDWQSLRKPARQGSKLADKGAYISVSDRRLQVKLTQEAKIVSDFSFFRAIFAFAGFVSALNRRSQAAPVQDVDKVNRLPESEKACKTRKRVCKKRELTRM